MRGSGWLRIRRINLIACVDDIHVDRVSSRRVARIVWLPMNRYLLVRLHCPYAAALREVPKEGNIRFRCGHTRQWICRNHSVPAALPGDENIAGLDIVVNDVAAVGGTERSSQFDS